MPDYDPFQRGPFPVGVVTVEFADSPRDRSLPVEIWYPAAEAHRGQDLDDTGKDHYKPLPFAPEVSQDAVRDAAVADGVRALIVFSHGFGGERRQTTHLCTHWASHGYVVAAMDHVGNTTADLMQMAVPGSAPPDPEALLGKFIADRPPDVSFVIDRMLAGDGPASIDAERIGMSGHSFGGWTTLLTTGRDARIRAALPLAPAGGRSKLALGASNALADAMDLNWFRDVPTLYLVADLDSILPLEGMRDLFSRTHQPSRGLVLVDADHFHFCDRVEQTHDMFKMMRPMLAGGAELTPDMEAMLGAMKPSSELCPGDHAYALLQGLGLAHMDAHVRDHADAAQLLGQDLEKLMADRGVKVRPL